MEKFLFKVAIDLIEKHGNSLSELQIILPSKRSGLYLNKHLSNLLGRAFIAPRIITWNEFLEGFSEISILDNLSLTFRLFESYKSVTSNNEPFDEFIKWSHVILSDFNEIDNYLLDANQVFRNLKDIKDIENWSFSEDELSPLQKDFEIFWEVLGALYKQFNEDLIQSNTLYSGGLKKQVAESISGLGNNLTFTYWAGFYAISPAEQKIIDNYLSEKKGYIYWDADEYYVDSPINSAGHFFRTTIKKANRRYDWVENYINSEKKVILHESPGNVLQAAIANEIIQQDGTNETALILSDEKMLIPTLENLDLGNSNFNVSLGIPLDNSEFIQLVHEILNMHEFAIKHGSSSSYKFFYKDLERVLENGLIVHLFPHLQENLSNFNKLGKTKYSVSDAGVLIQRASATELEFIFWEMKNFPMDILTCINALIDMFRSSLNQEKWNSFFAEIIYKANQFLEQLSNYCAKYPYANSISSFRKILKQLSSNEQLDFLGEPLGGLQVIGMLESRALDFERVILTSCNEGFLPSTSIKPSFLPFDLKKQLGLPTKKEFESIYAYYFYRLFQRSKEVHLIYNTKTPVMSARDKSRYISQLLFEKAENKFKPHILEEDYSTDLIVSAESELQLVKNEVIINSIKGNFLHRVSSSSLISYLTCPLDFYFKYILRVSDEDFTDEKIQPNTFGTILHGALENIYRPLLSKSVLSESDLALSKDQIAGIVEKVIEHESLQYHMSSKYNTLASNAIAEIIFQFISNERSNVAENKLNILGTEEKISGELELEINGKITIKGNIDRIDRYNDHLRIIDYKSGLVKSADLDIPNISREILQKKPLAFQLLFYVLLYSQQNSINEPILPSIITLRNPKRPPIPLMINKSVGINMDHIHQFENVIDDIISEILDDNQVMTHTGQGIYCNFCIK